MFVDGYSSSAGPARLSDDGEKQLGICLTFTPQQILKHPRKLADFALQKIAAPSVGFLAAASAKRVMAAL